MASLNLNFNPYFIPERIICTVAERQKPTEGTKELYIFAKSGPTSSAPVYTWINSIPTYVRTYIHAK